MGGLVVQIPSGAIGIFTTYHGTDYLLKHKSNVSQDDFNKFLDSVKEVCIRKAARFIVDNEMDAEGFSLMDQLQLQTYDFDFHVRSSKLIEFDSCLGKILNDNVLDLKSFAAIDQDKFVELFEIFPELPQNLQFWSKEKVDAQRQQKFVESLKHHINELKDLVSIDEIYAYRKSLANCEFITWESDFDEIFNRLRENWTNVSDDVLKIALQQHFSLLRALKSHPEASNGTILNKPTKTKLLLTSDIQEVIDCEHYAQRHKLLEKRLECYHQHMEFKRLIAQDVTELDAFGIKCVPKLGEVLDGPNSRWVVGKFTQSAKLGVFTLLNYLKGALSIQEKICFAYESKNLFKIKDAVKPASGAEGSGLPKGLPQPHQLNHMRAKFMGGSKKGLPALVNILFSFGVGISAKVNKLWL